MKIGGHYLARMRHDLLYEHLFIRYLDCAIIVTGIYKLHVEYKLINDNTNERFYSYKFIFLNRYQEVDKDWLEIVRIMIQ